MRRFCGRSAGAKSQSLAQRAFSGRSKARTGVKAATRLRRAVSGRLLGRRGRFRRAEPPSDGVSRSVCGAAGRALLRRLSESPSDF